MIKLRWKNKWIHFSQIVWSGTDNQCSRTLDFEIPRNPYDPSFNNLGINLGDLIFMYSDSTCLFVGTVTKRNENGKVDNASYTASDFMIHLLRSNATYKFKNTTPERATKAICKQFGISYTSIINTGINVGTIFFEDACVYDIIVSLFRRAMAFTKKKYFVTMNKNKLTVIEKGKASGVKLVQGQSISDSSYSDTLDNMVNRVVVFDKRGKRLGYVQNKANVSKYGVYQAVVKKENNKQKSKPLAQAKFVGVTREASLEAIGDIKAVSGKSIIISNKSSKLDGVYFITSDTHTFANGVHTMSLQLSFSNVMGEGADYEGSGAKKKDYRVKLGRNSKVWYINNKNSRTYHGTKECDYCYGKKLVQSTVAKMNTIKLKRGKNKGKRKFKPCKKCCK